MQDVCRDRKSGTWAILRFLDIAIVLAVFTAGLGLGQSVSAAPPVKKVMFLQPTTLAYPFYADFTNSFKQRLQEEPSINVEYLYEYSDLFKYTSDEAVIQAIAEVFRQKYKNNRPDIIVAHSVYGLRFLDMYCRDVFGGIPVIAYYTRPVYVDTSATPDNYTYCYPTIDSAKNVELILRMKPAIKELYVVMGQSEDERRMREELPQQLAVFSDRITITYLNNLSMTRLLERTRTITGDGAILFVDHMADAEGTFVVPAQVIRSIAAEAQVPVLGSYSTHLGGGGGVGGYILKMNDLGRKVGDLAVPILLGTAAPGRTKTVNISEYRFDWTEMERWGFDEAKLPPGSIILNRPPSLWQSYKWYIVSAVSFALLVMILQFGVIALYRRKQRKDEADLLRLDRLNLVGEMAASIGHEVRNPLTTVRGYLQMFLLKKDYVQHQQQFTTMVEELDRANDIISDFLSLAKNKAVEMKLGNLNDVINALFPMLQAEAFRTGHDLKVEMGRVPDITLDEKEIRQMLLNLAYNAFDAMEAGGRLTIASFVENGHVALAVSDTGKGIAREVIDKLGTPFLTTKQNGTGLGLPVCYRIAERHGAKIDVKTSPQGTTFSVYFKVSKG